MMRILFVDDEPGILQGLRDALRRQRSRWDMVFVDGGTVALDAMGDSPFDVIVSDMRMPHIDGAQLLARVREDHPQTIRIVLSGHAERDSILRALPTTHQFLSKPCAPDQIEQVIECAGRFRSLLPGESLRRRVNGLSQLPSDPRVLRALIDAVARPGGRIADIADIVEQDPAMCVKLLQLVNSAFFGLAQCIASVRTAVARLGLDLLRDLTLSAHVFSAPQPPDGAMRCLETERQRSLRAARLARQFAGDPALADEAYTLALVNGIGRLALATVVPAEYGAAHDQAQRLKRPSQEIELQMLGVSHANVGAYLLGIWGLPLALIEAVAYQHQPGSIGRPSRLAAAVHAAAALSAADGGESGLDRYFLEACGVTGELREWQRLAALPEPDGAGVSRTASRP
ncbi:MAG: HDOD domain-containing protein [Gammaproteobacteria bacterium]|nr:HDOD domain-containing protein [Gammaproteobacteria bacterium]